MMVAVGWAEPTIDFGIISPTSGSISYGGGSAPLVGAGISVDNVTGINGTPLNNNVTYNCLSCFFNFVTGGYVGSPAATLWLFAGGGSATLSGTLDVNGNNMIDGADVTGTLLSGPFSSGGVVDLSGGIFKIAVGSFGAAVHPGLSALYGTMPTPPNYTSGFNISFNASGLPPSAFTSTSILSGDVFAQTPEPFSIALLGTVLLLCTVIWRRQLRKS